MKNKKAQEIFGMSFGTIFSIIIIVFIISVAFFAIRHFVGLSKCTNIGLFYDDLREEVKDAWTSTSGRYRDEFTLKLPKSGIFGTGIQYVCFGKLSGATGSGTISEQNKNSLIDDFDYDPAGNYNVFMYPPNVGCDQSLSAIYLKCGSSDCVNTKISDVDQFFCKPIEDDGTVKIWLNKESTDYQVSILEKAP